MTLKKFLTRDRPDISLVSENGVYKHQFLIHEVIDRELWRRVVLSRFSMLRSEDSNFLVGSLFLGSGGLLSTRSGLLGSRLLLSGGLLGGGLLLSSGLLGGCFLLGDLLLGLGSGLGTGSLLGGSTALLGGRGSLLSLRLGGLGLDLRGSGSSVDFGLNNILLGGSFLLRGHDDYLGKL